MTQWTDQNPGAGDLGGLTDLAVWLRSTGTGLTTAAGSVRTATGVLHAGWSGQAADAWTTRAGQVAATTDQLPALFGPAATHMMTYVDTVTSIQLRAGLAQAAVGDATTAVRHAQATYDTARVAHLRATNPLSVTGYPGLAAAPLSRPDTGTVLRTASAQLNAAQDRLSTAQANLTALARERGQADSTLVAALAGLTPPGWDATTADLLAGAPGVDSTDSGWATAFTGWAATLPDTDAGRAALRQAVGWLSADQWTTLLADHPDALIGLLTPVDLSRDATYGALYTAAHSSADARTVAFGVAAAFTALTPAAQAATARLYPWLVGNLDGVSFAVRGQANAAVLEITIAQVTQDIAADQVRLQADQTDVWQMMVQTTSTQADANTLATDQGRLVMLNAVKTELAKPATVTGYTIDPKSLVVLDTTYQPGALPEDTGKAAIAIGNLDTATNVAVLVPGLDSFVSNYMPSIGGNTQNVQTTAKYALQVAGASGTVATVGWIGYQAPHLYTVVSDAAAHVGAANLDSFLWGVQANQVIAAGQDPHLTVLGHSYGSTTAAMAATADNPIDDLVLFGSPGVEVSSVSQFQVPAGHVYAAAANDDVVAGLRWFGVAPTDSGFLATKLRTDGGPTALDPDSLASSGHSEYYLLHSESLDNLSSIVAGQYQFLTQTTIPVPVPVGTP